MTSRRIRFAMGSQWLRRRLFWTAVLLLICLGGAGLATAVDRPATQDARPELSWATDRAAAPWLREMLAALRILDDDVAALSAAGRRVLIELNNLNPDQLEVGVTAGDAIVEGLLQTFTAAVQLRQSPPASVQPWRLGDRNLRRLERIDRALASSAQLPETWQQVARPARLAAELLESLRSHDESALAGLRAGSDGRWEDAVTALEAALAHLEDVAGLRDRLADRPEPMLVDELVAGHRRHDEALLALYRHMADGGSVVDDDGVQWRQAVDAARVNVPTPQETLQAVASEVAGPALSEALSTIEDARGDILAALEEDEGGEAD